jgi:hypothetical protein
LSFSLRKLAQRGDRERRPSGADRRRADRERRANHRMFTDARSAVLSVERSRAAYRLSATARRHSRSGAARAEPAITGTPEKGVRSTSMHASLVRRSKSQRYSS